MSAAEFDVVVVGGGTAGAIVAARLSERPGRRVCLLEWGPSDAGEPRALAVRRWFEMLEGEYDLDYLSVPQERANSHVRQARAAILGGCSSHNTMIAFRPTRSDLRRWRELGASGWDTDDLWPHYERLAARIGPIPPKDRNAYLEDAVAAAASALGVPRRVRWNDSEFVDGAGFFEIGYDPETGMRSSSSVAYLHPVMGSRPNLEVRLGCRATRLGRDAEGRLRTVTYRRADGSEDSVCARRELVLACGAIDTPRLLMLSGIGPGDDLRRAGIAVERDLPGVGANLCDHTEALVMWEARRPLPPEGATDWDAAALVRVDPDSPDHDVHMHLPLMTFAVHSERLGFATPAHALTMTPNVAKPRSRGRVWLRSPDPDEPPAIDYRWFTDPDGHDERMLVEGVRIARRVAAAPQLAGWVGREVFPGPEATSDEQISELARAAMNTVYHVSGTCRMGADADPGAVVDARLRLRGEPGVRVVDASVFPCVTSVNPMVTIMMVAERASGLIASDLDA